MKTPLENFFYPETVCLAGASSKEKSIGYELLKTINSYGYRGKVFPVNPKGGTILGHKVYTAIGEIAEEIDLAIVVVPKQYAESTVEELLDKGVKTIILITAGFRETGKEGEEAEKRILGKIKKAGARLSGPNCMGVINTLPEVSLNATFVAEKPETGRTGFFSQSGALGAAVLNSLRETDIRFAHFISAGNKADIDENDILKYWEKDDNISVMTFYLESFENGTEFLRSSLEVNKPVIVLKAGRSEGGKRAASSHTGALSGSDDVVDAVLRQFGIIRAANLNDLFNTAKGFEDFPAPGGNRVAVITNAGGPAILCVDSLEKEGLVLAEFSSKTEEQLGKLVHPEGSIKNPVDLLPGGNAETYRNVIKTVLEDDGVDSVISIFVEPVMVQPFELVEGINSLQSDKPVMQVIMPLPEFRAEYTQKSEYKTPVFRNPEDPSVVLSNMLFYKKSQKVKKTGRLPFDTPSQNKNYRSGYLSAGEAAGLAKEFGLPVINEKTAAPDELGSLSGLPYPLVLKGLAKDVIHKSELDAVKLDIKNREELLEAGQLIKESFRSNNLEVEKFLIQPFIKSRYELLLGGYRDPFFGPVIVFGTGGKYVEEFKDTTIRSAYLSNDDISEMIKATAAGRIMFGVRGEKEINTGELYRIIRSAAGMMTEVPSIAEFDINPLIVTPGGELHAVDIRIRIS